MAKYTYARKYVIFPCKIPKSAISKTTIAEVMAKGLLTIGIDQNFHFFLMIHRALTPEFQKIKNSECKEVNNIIKTWSSVHPWSKIKSSSKD